MTYLPEELKAYVVPRSCPDQLTGTFKQVEWATAIRRSMLSVARRHAPADLVDMMMCIRDSGWWIANRSRPLDKLKWPSVFQMRGPEINLFIDGTSSPEVVESATLDGKWVASAPRKAEAPRGSAVCQTPSLDRHPVPRTSIRVRTS